MPISNNQLEWRINTVVDYLTIHWGLPVITAKTIVLNLIGTLASPCVQVDWRNSKAILKLTLVVAPGVVEENRGYADFLAEPIDREIERLQELAVDEASFSTKRQAFEEMINAMPPSDPSYAKVFSEYAEFLEAGSPWIMLRTLPDAGHRSPLQCTIVLDDTGDVLRQALAHESGSQLVVLDKGYKPEGGRTCYYGAILEAPPEGFGKILGSVCTQFWQPIILPGASSFVPTRPGAPARASVAQAWGEVVSEALIIRRAARRLFTVSSYGDEIVSRVIKEAEGKSESARHRGKFLWAAKVTVRIAAISHLMQGGEGEEISPSAWDAAEAHMRELIDAHAAATDVAAPRIMKARAINGRPEDFRTLSNYLMDNPGASLRDVTRGLSKRQPGYWKTMHAAYVRQRSQGT